MAIIINLMSNGQYIIRKPGNDLFMCVSNAANTIMSIS